MIRASVFAGLDAPRQRIYSQERGRVKLLPRCCGTYAFHDREGDLLYIGKANDLRSRVRSHLRDSQTRFLLPSWTHLIDEIETRPAASEAEALLVEAHLVGRLRPPFNRQMRSWSKYCYLVRTDDAFGPLSISTQLPSWRQCFGPYRSRRQAVAIIEAVFRLVSDRGLAATALRSPSACASGAKASGAKASDAKASDAKASDGPAGEARLLSRRSDEAHLLAPKPQVPLGACYALLAGRDDAFLRMLEATFAGMPDDEKRAAPPGTLPHICATLRKAYERAVLLRHAEEVAGGLIVLPGPDDARTIVVVTHTDLHIRTVEPVVGSTRAFLGDYRTWVQPLTGQDQRLPKAVCDCLCVASRQVMRQAKGVRFLPRQDAEALTPGRLVDCLRA